MRISTATAAGLVLASSAAAATLGRPSLNEPTGLSEASQPVAVEGHEAVEAAVEGGEAEAVERRMETVEVPDVYRDPADHKLWEIKKTLASTVGNTHKFFLESTSDRRSERRSEDAVNEGTAFGGPDIWGGCKMM